MELPNIDNPTFKVRTYQRGKLVLEQTCQRFEDIDFETFSGLKADFVEFDFAADKRIWEVVREQNLLLRYRVPIANDQVQIWGAGGSEATDWVPFNVEAIEEVLKLAPKASENGNLYLIKTGQRYRDKDVVQQSIDTIKAYFVESSEEAGWGTAIAGLAAAAIFSTLIGKKNERKSSTNRNESVAAKALGELDNSSQRTERAESNVEA